MKSKKSIYSLHIQCHDSYGKVGCFLTYIKPINLFGEQYGGTYKDLEGLFNSYEYRKAKQEGLII